jgi:Ni,Fe-hydrogenase III large subunit
MCKQLFKLPSALSRFERTGVVSYDDVLSLGTVGMSARMSNLKRDIRISHPYSHYNKIEHEPICKRHGDVYSRVQIRKLEVKQSINHIRKLLEYIPVYEENKSMNSPKPNTFSISLVEGWRGEICHCAITDEKGELLHYKVKDPSFHNWMALALSVRNNEISDFPICNKSFNLSYCGHDL